MGRGEVRDGPKLKLQQLDFGNLTKHKNNLKKLKNCWRCGYNEDSIMQNTGM